MANDPEISELITDVREQVLYMQELGVELLDANLSEAGNAVIADNRPQSAVAVTAKPPAVIDLPRDLPEMPISEADIDTAKPAVKRTSKLSGLPSLSKRPARVPTPENGNTTIAKENEAHDINSAAVIGAETKGLSSTGSVLADALFDVGPDLPTTGETIEAIRNDIGDCTRCPLYTGRTQIVHSTGNLQSDLMFVGEAPGADEDEQGFPFVGRAGQLLTKIIEGMGFRREDVFIGNINRCRPPGNRAPTLPEAHTCRPFLLREIAVVRPKVIVVMGNTALHNLLDTKDGITKVRGSFQDYFGVKVMPTFHPAYLLRDPHKKREVWEDMKKVRDYLKTAK